MSHDTEAASSKRKYDSAIDTSCAFETTANFDSYGNVSFDPCEYTLHTAANAENNYCSIKLVCFLTSVNVDLFDRAFRFS